MLMRIDEMELCSAGKSWRAGGGFPSANARMREREGKKHVGVAEDVVVEEVAGGGAEVADVEGPPLEWDRKAEFALLVALAMEGQETLLTGDETLIAG